MKRTYIKPELELLRLETEDIMTNSTPFAPFGLDIIDDDGDGLDDLLVPLVAHFIEHQRKEDGRREGKDNFQQADDQRVHEHLLEVGGVKELDKVFEQRIEPFAAHDAVLGLVVFEGYNYAVHGRILEDGKPNDRRQKQKQKQRQKLRLRRP